MFAPRWPKNTAGSLPRTPPDLYFRAGKLVFTQETLVFQRSSVLVAGSPKYALRKLSEGQLGHFLTPLEGILGSICLELGPNRALAGPYLAPTWPHLRSILAQLGPNLAQLGASWPHLAPSWPDLGPFWHHLTLILAHWGGQEDSDG